MKKLLFYSLLVVSALTSCSKNDDPAPSANVEGKWNLATANLTIKSLFGDNDDIIDYKDDNVYIELKSNNKFSTNLVLTDSIDDLLVKGKTYESDYELTSDAMTLHVYSELYDDYLPVKLKIQSSNETEMVLVFTKAELAELMKAYDKLDESDENTQMLALITSINAVFTFTR